MGRRREDLKENLRRRGLFLRSMIANPREVGAVWPTSRWAVRDLLEMGDLARARTVVEFGVGTGVYTEEVLKQLHPEGTFLAFEIDPDLASAVGARLKDPRLRVINDSAENVEDYLEGAKADYIVSSVPFTSLPADVRRSLLEAARHALAPNGQMLILQYSTAVLPYLPLCLLGHRARRWCQERRGSTAGRLGREDSLRTRFTGPRGADPPPSPRKEEDQPPLGTKARTKLRFASHRQARLAERVLDPLTRLLRGG